MRLFILFPVVLGNLIFSNIAYSSISICDWDQARIPSSISTEKLVPYFEKLKSECEYSQKFSELSQKLRAIGKHVEKLNYYQGLRYVDRYAYNQARKNNIPLPVVFQLKDEDYNLPIGLRSRLVWDNWSIGIRNIESYTKVLQHSLLTLENFKDIHKGFYTLGTESGTYGNVRTPGQIRSPFTSIIGWNVSSEEAEKIRDSMSTILKEYRTLNMVLNQKAEAPFGSYIDIVRIDGNRLKSAHPFYVQDHLDKLLTILNIALQQRTQNHALVINDQIFTPLEFALFVQQTIVRIHAFHDGNGRVSRFFQDLILSLFEMPFVSSGNLYADDMIASLENYYLKAQKSNAEQLERLEFCLTDPTSDFDCQEIN